MIRIGIAEDDAGYREQLRAFLRQFEKENETRLEVAMFTDGMDLAEQYMPVYDILLLDISMPLLDGMKTAKSIRKKDPAVLIIFITNMKQYAIESYKVGAFDYVLKPVSYFALQAKLKKAVTMINNQVRRYIMLHVEGAMQRVDVSRISYIEVFNHKLTFHTEDGDYQVSASLRSIEEQLEGCHFSKCNKSYLVNLQHVVYISADIVKLRDGTELSMSRLRKKEFLIAAADYYGGGGL